MKPTKILRLLFVAELLTPALLALFFETNLLEAGILGGDALLAYWMQTVAVVLTICFLPLAWHLLKFRRVKQRIQQSELEYTRWCIVRMALLETPLLYSTLTYYLLGFNPSCGYMALIALVAFFFVWPSDGRMREERELIYDQEES